MVGQCTKCSATADLFLDREKMLKMAGSGDLSGLEWARFFVVSGVGGLWEVFERFGEIGF